MRRLGGPFTEPECGRLKKHTGVLSTTRAPALHQRGLVGDHGKFLGLNPTIPEILEIPAVTRNSLQRAAFWEIPQVASRF